MHYGMRTKGDFLVPYPQRWRIKTKSGVDHGIWGGLTQRDALESLLRDLTGILRPEYNFSAWQFEEVK